MTETPATSKRRRWAWVALGVIALALLATGVIAWRPLVLRYELRHLSELQSPAFRPSPGKIAVHRYGEDEFAIVELGSIRFAMLGLDSGGGVSSRSVDLGGFAPRSCGIEDSNVVRIWFAPLDMHGWLMYGPSIPGGSFVKVDFEIVGENLLIGKRTIPIDLEASEKTVVLLSKDGQVQGVYP